jgi:ABC-type Fe3+/spermidine/putrescine transport system ATPase subunit
MTSVSLEQIVKSFDSTPVLSDVSLSIAAGEFFSLLGPSGCGKSTLLRIIAGLEIADSGSVFIGGVNMSDTPPQKRGVGMVFQQYALWPHLTIGQNVRFGLETLPLTNRERDNRMSEALNRVQMAPFKDRYPHQISGGQQQRVALARSLAMQPSVILLDEPLSNLDARLRAEIRHELADLHLNLGTTMIYVTHDQEDALSLSTRLAILNNGRIEQVGTPQEVYRDPRSVFCARFIGDANLLPCSIKRRISDSKVSVSLDQNQDITIDTRCADRSLAASTKGYLCVRPSAVSIEPIEPNSTRQSIALAAKVLRSSYRGAEFDIEVSTPDGLRLRGLAKTSEHTVQIESGADVSVFWPAESTSFIISR